MGGSGTFEPPVTEAVSTDLLASEDAGWERLHALFDSLGDDELGRPGYYEEGWTAKDVLGHVGAWLAQAGVALERIRVGTYRPEEIDVDELNARSLEALRDLPPDEVRAQAAAARSRMLGAWRDLPELTPDAAFWIRKAGAEHYAEHLPRLATWVRDLREGRA